jgi:hypothetical protein
MKPQRNCKKISSIVSVMELKEKHTVFLVIGTLKLDFFFPNSKTFMLDINNSLTVNNSDGVGCFVTVEYRWMAALRLRQDCKAKQDKNLSSYQETC